MNTRTSKREGKALFKSLTVYDQQLLDVMLEANLSDSVLNFWKEWGEKWLSKLQTLKIYLHRLIAIRNIILTTLKSIDEYMHEGGMATWYSKNDYVEIVTLFEKLSQLGYLSHHKLWGFQKRRQNTDSYEDDELTE